MLHHLSLGVRDIERTATFYDAALAPLGYERVWSDIRPGEPDQAIGYGLPGGGDKLALKQYDDAAAPGAGFHGVAPASDDVTRCAETKRTKDTGERLGWAVVTGAIAHTHPGGMVSKPVAWARLRRG